MSAGSAGGIWIAPKKSRCIQLLLLELRELEELGVAVERTDVATRIMPATGPLFIDRITRGVIEHKGRDVWGLVAWLPVRVGRGVHRRKLVGSRSWRA